MFGLFNKKYLKPSVTEEDKVWIEDNLIWLIKVFGSKRIINGPFLLPELSLFPYDNLSDEKQFNDLFVQVCGNFDLNPNEIEIKFFDDLVSKQWNTWIFTQGRINEFGGHYEQESGTEEKIYKIHLAKSNIYNTQRLISTLSHELAHAKLIGGKFITGYEHDMEPLTDLATIYFGFGVFFANSCEIRDKGWTGRSGYLPNELISYSNALLCYIAKKSSESYIQYLNTNTRALFIQDYNYLAETNDTLLTNDAVQEYNELYRIYKNIDDGFKKSDFEYVIEEEKKLIENNKNDKAAYCDWGYALLQMKKYEEAIEKFTTAIDIDPFISYAFNNRGYCRLQLGDYENALTYLESSFEMDPNNKYQWRNMGVYYIFTKNYEKALENFEEAIKINPKIDLINFYFAHTYAGLGDSEKAHYYMDLSKKLNEYNDSVLI